MIRLPLVTAVTGATATHWARCVVSAELKADSAPGGQNPSGLRLVVRA
jgi:hypothetical protein